jgi:hypothetical protein
MAIEFRLDPGHVAELGGAYRGEVLRVREQYRPGIADPVMKSNPSFGRLRLEVRSDVANLQTHGISSLDALSLD